LNITAGIISAGFPQAGSDGQENIAGLSLEPTVLIKATLPA
jgi:hypothetical protein